MNLVIIITTLVSLFSNERFWQTIASITSVVAILLLYKQISDTKRIAAYDFLKTSRDLFFSNELAHSKFICCMLWKKKELYNDQVTNGIDSYSNDLMDILLFFEDLGLSINRKIGDKYLLWTIFGDEIKNYYKILYPVILHYRKEWNDNSLYCEFEKLHSKILKIDLKNGGHQITDNDVCRFLDGEMKITFSQYDEDIHWYLQLEKLSFPEVDQMTKEEVLKFVEEPMNEIIVIKIYNTKIGAIAYTYLDRNNVYIESFAILPQFRNMQFGTNTIDKLVVSFEEKEIASINLHVRESSRAAKLYKEMKFKIIKKENTIYKDNEIALLMKRELNGIRI